MSNDSPTSGEPAGSQASGLERAALEAARLELEASQHQIAELEGLLHDLPAIFERKFGERIEPLLERQRLLLDENHALHDRLSRLLPQAGETGGSAIPPESTTASPASPAAAPGATAADPTSEPVAADAVVADPAVEPPERPGQPSLPSLPQLRRGRAGTSRLMGQNGRVA